MMDSMPQSMTPTPFGSADASARQWTLVATILGSSLTFIDGTVVNVALPALQADLHATITDVQWVIEAYSLFLGGLLLVGGSLGDQFGRKRVFLVGVGGVHARVDRLRSRAFRFVRSSRPVRCRAWARRSWCPAASRSSARRSTDRIAAARSGHGPASAPSRRASDPSRAAG